MDYRVIDIRNKLPRHSTKKWKKKSDIKRIIVHCTAGTNQDPFLTARYHIGPNHICKTGCPAIVYTDYITRDGTIYHCNNYDDWTWHASLYNRSSVGITMAYQGLDNPPPEAQRRALMKHLVILCLYLKVLPKNVIGHRECPWMSTLLGNGSKRFIKWCPGKVVNLVQMRAELTMRLQRRLAAEGLYKGKIDGIFGPLSRGALYSFNPLSKQNLDNRICSD